jgi:hypothetical protein
MAQQGGSEELEKEGGREKEASEWLKVLFARIAEIFGILDVSFFVAGAVCFGAIIFGAYVFRVWTTWEQLAPLYASGLHIGGVVIACYVLGMVCFAARRQRRKRTVFNELRGHLERFGLFERYAHFVDVDLEKEADVRRALAAAEAHERAAARRVQSAEADEKKARAAHDEAQGKGQAEDEAKKDLAQAQEVTRLAREGRARARIATKDALARVIQLHNPAIGATVSTAPPPGVARFPPEEIGHPPPAPPALAPQQTTKDERTRKKAEEKKAEEDAQKYTLLYTRLWAEVRQSKDLSPSFNLVLRYWVLAAMCDGLTTAIALWAVLWPVFIFTSWFYPITKDVWVDLPPALKLGAMSVMELMLIAAAVFCAKEAKRYTEYQVYEIVVTLAHAHDEEDPRP